MNQPIEVGPADDLTPADAPLIRQTDLGEEKFCPGCENWWPHDSAFFYATGRGGFTNTCRACRLDVDRVRRGIANRPLPPVPEVFSVCLRGAA